MSMHHMQQLSDRHTTQAIHTYMYILDTPKNSSHHYTNVITLNAFIHCHHANKFHYIFHGNA